MNDLRRERFTGFAELYDEFRPSTPVETLRTILSIYGSVNDIEIADIGCGTGLSTFLWAPHAKQVYGIEPNVDMINIARNNLVAAPVEGVQFINGSSTDIPLRDDSIDLITCSQSFHWMEPTTSLREFSRILKQGGLLAIYDYDWPPAISESLEQLYADILKRTIDVLEESNAQAHQWPKQSHLKNMRESGRFRFTKELCFSEKIVLNEDRFIGMIESQGSVQQALKMKDPSFEDFYATTKDSIRTNFKAENAALTYRVRLGIC